jgi:predicted ATPase/class 3 adenylate cyclase
VVGQTLVAFLFTDIEGSTALLQRLGQAYAGVLADHHRLIRDCLAAHEGQEIDTQGDAFFALFTSPSGCAAAAIGMQQALAAHSWPRGEVVRVRMGIHCGEASLTDVGPVGLEVHRAARVAAVGHGGQIVVSAATAALLRDSLPPGASLVDLGLHRLKDLGRPEQIFQLDADGMAAVFPPLRSLDNPEMPNNLPGFLSTFVGREAEVVEVTAMVGSSRLVTLTGAGGSGKTRLALQAAAGLVDGTGQGVWLIELAALADPGQLSALVAQTLRIRGKAGATVLDSLIDALSDQKVLLVLDNCEHVISAAAELAGRIGQGCPGVHLLATSREPLGIDGERVYRVPPLALPPGDSVTAADLAGSDAVALFAERAAGNGSGFRIEDSVAGLVASVCRRLDGIPLALELAAARLATMSLEHLAGRLDQRFRLLTGGSRNALPRQQTLRALIDWSYDLLTGPEHSALRVVSVFAGGFELEAAEAVCAATGVEEFEVAGIVGSLVEKSLVMAERSAGSLRYRLLETIRQYGLEQLVKAGAEEAAHARGAHADFYLQLAEGAAPKLRGHDQARWLRRLDTEWDNLKAAMAHLFAEPDQTEAVLRLGVALRGFAESRGHHDMVPFLRSALARPAAVSGSVRMTALMSAASQEISGLGWSGDRDAMRSAAELGRRALELAQELSDDMGIAMALAILADTAWFEGDQARGRMLAEQAVLTVPPDGDPWSVGWVTSTLAWWLAYPRDDPIASDVVRARQLGLENIERFRRLGDRQAVSMTHATLANAEIHAGRPDAACTHYQEALAADVQTGSTFMVTDHQLNLGIVLLMVGRLEDAAPLFHAALRAFRQRGERMPAVAAMLGVACAAGTTDARRAAQLHGAVDALAADAGWEDGWRPTGPEKRMQNHCRAELREFLGAAEYEHAYRLGADLTYEQAADLALGRADPAGSLSEQATNVSRQ